MKITFGRSNSLGYAGTVRNAQHHAQKLLPLIYRVAKDILNWKYVEWVQGHNYHIFITSDDRKVILRPIHSKGNGYIGVSIELSKTRLCATGTGMLVTSIMSDDDLDLFSALMAALSMPKINNNDPTDKNALDGEEDDDLLVKFDEAFG